MLRLLTLLVMLLAAPYINAQDVRYISDDIFVVLHSGPGTDYRWVTRLTPGTQLTRERTSGDWARVITEGGTAGWVKKEYLTADLPAQRALPAALQRVSALEDMNRELDAQLQALQAERAEWQQQVAEAQEALDRVTGELTHLKQVSGRALQLDNDNRQLVEQVEGMRATLDMLEAENQRLNGKLRSEDFINGALAVLMGVIITLVVPRLWPKRRPSSSWA